MTRRGWCGSGSMLRSLRGMTEIGTICPKPAASRSSRSRVPNERDDSGPTQFQASEETAREVRPKLGVMKKKILGPLAGDACACADEGYWGLATKNFLGTPGPARRAENLGRHT